jgi:D-alanyl-D-alanine carboxypeptidase
VSSVHRDEKHIVAVVLGGTSNAARDARMRQLIEEYISQASTQRTAPIIVEANGEDGVHDGGRLFHLTRQDIDPLKRFLDRLFQSCASRYLPHVRTSPQPES